MSSLGIVKQTLTAAVADAGTVTVPYPTGTDQAALTGSVNGGVVLGNGATGRYKQGAGGATFTFGASNITITNASGTTWPAGVELIASFGNGPRNGSYNVTLGTDFDQAKRGNAT